MQGSIYSNLWTRSSVQMESETLSR